MGEEAVLHDQCAGGGRPKRRQRPHLHRGDGHPRQADVPEGDSVATLPRRGRRVHRRARARKAVQAVRDLPARRAASVRPGRDLGRMVRPVVGRTPPLLCGPDHRLQPPDPSHRPPPRAGDPRPGPGTRMARPRDAPRRHHLDAPHLGRQTLQRLPHLARHPRPTPQRLRPAGTGGAADLAGVHPRNPFDPRGVWDGRIAVPKPARRRSLRHVPGRHPALRPRIPQTTWGHQGSLFD